MITDQLSSMNAASASMHVADAIRLMGLFRDGVILQRRKPIAVWGWAAPKRRIEGQFCGAEAVSYSAADGSFYMEFPPMECAEHLTMRVSDGSKSVTITDIAIGEVFLLAGQSNMQFDLASAPDGDIPSAFPERTIRFFRVRSQVVPGGAQDVDGDWVPPAQRRGISAVGYFFAEKYCIDEAVPVGLIDVSVGGVSGESFASAGELRKIPGYAGLIEEYHRNRFQRGGCDECHQGDEVTPASSLMRRVREAMTPLPPIDKSIANFFQPHFDDAAWKTQELPDSWMTAGYPHPGRALYRRRIDLPENFIGRELTLSLGACDCADITYWDGNQVGAMGVPEDFSTWNTPRIYTIPAELTQHRQVVIAVQVATLCSVCSFGGMTGPAEAMFLQCGEERLSLAGDWKMRMANCASSAPMEAMLSCGAGCEKSFHAIYDNMLRPMARFAIAGVLFYQGEANTLCLTELYKPLLVAIVHSVRNLWENPQLPFLIFELSGFNRPHAYTADSTWARIREAQLAAALEATECIPVPMSDTGDSYNIHPPHKQVPGRRAAVMMEKMLRGESVRDALYLHRCVIEEHGVCRLEFSAGVSPLLPVSGYCGIVGITASAAVLPLKLLSCGDFSLTLQLPEEPLSCIAYGWCDNPMEGPLRSINGLPVFPFKKCLS